MVPPVASSRVQTHTLESDLIVVGGGMAGICAALAAARNGIRVVLIQDRSSLGGNASSEIKMHIVGADCHGARPGARESGIIEELRLEDAFRNPHRSYSQWDLLLYEKIKSEPAITLLLDTTLIGCTKDGQTNEIRTVSALRNSTEDRFEISGRFFADCSGDSRLGLEAGADFHVGRESREAYGESLARPVADNHTLGSSILITARNYETPQPFHPPYWIRKFTKTDLFRRPIRSFEYGYWWFEWGGQLDTIKDNETIRHELLGIALGIWDYIKNSGDYPESSSWALDWVGAIPGKRESRRLLGPHVLTQGDIQSGQLFPDAVAYGGWAIDLHPPEGVDAVTEPPFTPTHLDRLYTIPLRSLYSRNISNLLFAGRNISATHVAFASTRVMATCAVMGQAIGTAAALAVERDLTLQDLTASYAILQLQQMLLKDDAFIPAIRNETSDDKAIQSADISASSSLDGHDAGLVVDGITRDLASNFGPWTNDVIHHWESKSLPAWLELRLRSKTTIKEIHLTFDSGFSRELTLTLSDYINQKIVRGPQPEIVRSYTITADGRTVVTERDNFLRKRIHILPEPISATSIRVHVEKTHGASTARIFEVRIY